VHGLYATVILTSVMSRKTYKTTKHIVDTNTGEVVQTEQWYRKATDSDNFIKFMIEQIYLLVVLSKGEYDVLLSSIRFVDYDSTFHVDGRYKDIVSSLTGKTPSTISTILSSLVKKGLLYRVSRGRYELNPTIMWKGTEVNRMKRIAHYKEVELRKKNEG
jgi:DNA-binding transcriptional ArsR family regulator